MKPARFDFLRPSDQRELLDALDEYGAEASILGGGQSLVPMLNMRLARPRLLLDSSALTGLAVIDDTTAGLRVGCGVTQQALEAWPDLEARQPLLAQAIKWIGHRQTRARGTVCGSVAHADPSAELVLCLVAQQGRVNLRSRKGARQVRADDFFVGMMSTARNPNEMIESVIYPFAVTGRGYAFGEMGRRHGDFAIVAVAAVVGPDSAAIAVGGVDDRPRRFALPVPDGPGGISAIDDALNEIAWRVNARDDQHASAYYRRSLVRNLGRNAVMEAASCRV